MLSLFSFDEDNRGLGLGCHPDSPCEFNLRGVHCVHHVLDGRATLLANVGGMGDCRWCSSGGVSIQITLGLLVVVLCLYTARSTSVLLHLTAVFFLVHGRLLLGSDKAGQRQGNCEQE